MAGLITLPAAQAEDSNPQFENLVAVDDAQMAVAYIDPNADFSVFKRAMILDTFVSIRSGWERDQRRGTLYIELYDSVSGQIISRAFDRQAARNASSMMRWTNRASNTADARRVFRDWANTLRSFMDSHYSGK